VNWNVKTLGKMPKGRQLTLIEATNTKKRHKVDSKAKSPRQQSRSDQVDQLSSDSENDEFPNKKPEVKASGLVGIPPKAKRARFVLDTPSKSKAIEVSETSIADPWVEKYAPTTVSQVALHSRRTAEVKAVMEKMIHTGSPRLLILSGPAGTSKSTIAKSLAQEYGYSPEEVSPGSSKRLVEWNTPSYTANGGLMASFADFLNGVRFANSSHKRSIVLVEDIPNISHYTTRQLFIASLNEWINSESTQKAPPLIVVFTEVEVPEEDNSYYSRSDSIVLERIIPKSILSHRQVEVIKFLPINTLLLTKVLKTIVQREQDLLLKIPKKEIDAAVKTLSEQGDVRAAINGFEFWARWRRSGHSVPVGRGNQLGLFHALGRIIHGGHKDSKGHSVSSDQTVVESVLQDWGYSNADGNFSLAIFENYLGAQNSQMSIEDVARCSELLSLQDNLISFNPVAATEIACRGIRQSIRNSQINTQFAKLFRQLTYPKFSRLTREQIEHKVEYLDYRLEKSQQNGTLLELDDIVLLQGFYARRSRLGGQIRGQYEKNNDGYVSPTIAEPVVEAKVPQPSGLMFADDPIEDSEGDDSIP
jgi:cell cycle checkpoint protein